MNYHQINVQVVRTFRTKSYRSTHNMLTTTTATTTIIYIYSYWRNVYTWYMYIYISRLSLSTVYKTTLFLEILIKKSYGQRGWSNTSKKPYITCLDYELSLQKFLSRSDLPNLSYAIDSLSTVCETTPFLEIPIEKILWTAGVVGYFPKTLQHIFGL